jgi:O-antigen/teichoic acid export membrane protein
VTGNKRGASISGVPAASLSWNLLGGVWSGLLILGATPMLVGGYGIDRFGLIGLWITLQVVLGLVDLGLSSTLGRVLAQSVHPSSDHDAPRDVLTTFETVTWLISGFLLSVAIYVGTSSGNTWLQSVSIPQSEMTVCLGLLLAALALQFPSILYSGGLAGVSRHRELNIVQISVNSVRWIGGAALAVEGAPLYAYFCLQSFVSLVQSVALRTALRAASGLRQRGSFSASVLRQHATFALGMAGTSSLAVVIANADRLLIGSFHTTADVGRYSVAFIGSSVIQMLLTPFYRVYFPRFSALVASSDGNGLREEYTSSARWLSCMVVPTAFCLCVFSDEVLMVWIGEKDPASAAVLSVLAIGVGAAALSWLQGALQQAHGVTSLHLRMLALSVVVGLPASVYCIAEFGIVGAAALWVVHGLVSLTVEPCLMHRRFLCGELITWYRAALLVPLASSAAVIIPSRLLMPDSLSRWMVAAWLVMTGTIALALTAVAQYSDGLAAKRRLG